MRLFSLTFGKKVTSTLNKRIVKEGKYASFQYGIRIDFVIAVF